MPRLSIVIPCAEEAREFETTLASVLQNRPDDCEVMVVQPRSYPDPYGLKDEVRFVEAPADSALVDLVNFAMECAAADLVHVLSCDLEVTEGWLQPVLPHFEDATVGSVSPLIVLKTKAEQVIARGVHYTRGGVRQVLRASARRSHGRAIISPTFAAGVYRRRAVVAAGGFCAALGTYADVDLGLALRAEGYRCVHEAGCLVTCEYPLADGSLSVAGGRAAEQCFWRHADTARWADCYVRHPLSCLAECCRQLPRPPVLQQLWGRLTGWRKPLSPRVPSCQSPSSQSPSSQSPSSQSQQERSAVPVTAPPARPREREQSRAAA